jgi:diguanylate cyclase (GGDEF)-like protein/PAS domain S-box-containing protein
MLILCNPRRGDETFSLPPELMMPGISFLDIFNYTVTSGLVSREDAEDYIRCGLEMVDRNSVLKSILQFSDGRVFSVLHGQTPDGGSAASHEEVGVDSLIQGREVDYFSILQSVTFPVVVTSLVKGDNKIVYSNLAFEALTGYSADEYLGKNCRFLQGAETDRSAVAEIRAAINDGRPIRRELLNYRKSGERFWNELDIVPRKDAGGVLIGFIGIQNDVTARHHAEARVESVVNNVPGFLYQQVMKSDGTIEVPYINSSIDGPLRLSKGELGKFIERGCDLSPNGATSAPAPISQSASTMLPLQIEFPITAPAGGTVWIRSFSTPRRSKDEIVWDAIAIDVSAERAAAERIAFLTLQDPLTGLPNRHSFGQSLHDAIDAWEGLKPLGLWVVDISGLSEINDVLGRDVGDLVLRHAASRLSALCLDEVGAIVGRTGGDEFSIVRPMDDLKSDPDGFRKRVSLAISKPEGAENQIGVRCSIGFASFQGNNYSGDGSVARAATELQRRADIALLAARKVGPDTFFRYQEALDEKLRDRLQNRRSIQQALAAGQFELHYHPLVELASGAIVGAEALIRWRHPQLGMRTPNFFIPDAEEAGLIVPLGEWVVREAMRQVREWKQDDLKPPRIAINVSSIQIKNSDFLATLVRALRDFNSDAGDFELELTEGQIFEQSKATVDALTSIRSAGFPLTIDDFGTGYSSLQYVRDLPVSKVKIDQIFVRNMVRDSKDAVIVRAILAMAKELSLDVVAEGIETAMQRDFLRAEGCKVGQGYFFSLPLTPKDFALLLRSHLPR